MDSEAPVDVGGVNGLKANDGAEGADVDPGADEPKENELPLGLSALLDVLEPNENPDDEGAAVPKLKAAPAAGAWAAVPKPKENGLGLSGVPD